ncbi:MAG: alpha/beta hydrolase [Ralstonia sp.]|nr:MAG: alpha/beta hydrolase [Ralstonia sp.]
MNPGGGEFPIAVRRYGTHGPTVIVLHGGPGAPGSMAPIARSLSDAFQVLEPLQRGSGDTQLTVGRHVADLHEVVRSNCARPPALVGHSWGAMLALAYAAEHPDAASSLALVGCGTFDEWSRERMQAIRRERLGRDAEVLRNLEVRAPEGSRDAEAQLLAAANLIHRCDTVALLPHEDETLAFDAQAYEETWGNMLGLQHDGIYPRAFRAIQQPAIMLHGAEDPHPGRMIHASVVSHMPQLEYREFERCGHYPWLEVEAHKPFHAALREWLTQNASDVPPDFAQVSAPEQPS